MSRQAVFDAMGNGPVTTAELAERAGIEPLSARAYLVQWTKAGAVIRDDGGRYRRTVDELPRLSREPRETVGIDQDDQQWMEYWRLPREQRLRL